MERGDFRKKLWSTDKEIIRWARKNGGAGLSNEQAREKGMEKLKKLAPHFEEDLDFLQPFKEEPEFHSSFEAWTYARRNSERLLSELEELQKSFPTKVWINARHQSEHLIRDLI